MMKTERSERESTPPTGSGSPPAPLRSLCDDLDPAPIVTSTTTSSPSSLPSLPSNGLFEKRVYVSNIPFKWGENDIVKLFAPFGKTKEVEIVSNSRGSKGFGFATFFNEEEADCAISALNGRMFLGRTIQVTEAVSRRKSSTKPMVFPLLGSPMDDGLNMDQYSTDMCALLLQQKQLQSQQLLQQYLQSQQQSEIIARALGLPTANVSDLLAGSLQYPMAGLPGLNIDPCALQLQQLQYNLLQSTGLPTQQHAFYRQWPTVPNGIGVPSLFNPAAMDQVLPAKMPGSSSSNKNRQGQSRNDGTVSRYAPY